jgi:hypothetical protein
LLLRVNQMGDESIAPREMQEQEAKTARPWWKLW